MRIVIDLQGAQTEGSRSRGIGRYTLSIAQAIVRGRGEHEVFIALNGLFSDTIEPLRADFDRLLPQGNIRVWHAPGPVRSWVTRNEWRRETAELIREAFLASLKPDMVLVSSLFEGFGDSAVTSIGMLSTKVPTAVILYDLIPLVHRDPYLKNPVAEAWYENKLGHLRRAELLLAISESSRQEGVTYLGFPAEQAVNISAAAEPQFRPMQVDARREVAVRQHYGLHRPFVMYAGGIDHRKNIEGLIRAYAKLPKTLRLRHQLAVVCFIQPHDRQRFVSLAKQCKLEEDEFILTGFVPEEDLPILYNLCKVFVFPSWHEGFGLPALEAMSCGRAVIGANTSSLPEVIGREDALFDSRSEGSIAEKLTQVLINDSFRLELERHGLEQAKKFSWDESAKQAIGAFENWYEQHKSKALNYKPPVRPRLAYVSPLPPERNGISDYSAELLPELARHYYIEVIVAQDVITDPWIKANCPVRSVEWFKANANCFDRVLYHFGNSHFHQQMFRLLEEVPGVVVLHDFFLSGIVAHMDAIGFAPGSWVAELYHAHGYKAVQERFHAQDPADVIWKYPCSLSILQRAQGMIVHSENSRRLAKHWHGLHAAEDWAVIPLLRVPAFAFDRAKARRALNLNADDFIICSFGLLGPHKLNHRLLKALLASSLADREDCVLVFVGENHGGEYGQELFSTIRNSGLGERICITGWVDTATFRQYLAAADLCVQLRTLSRGETSAAVLDCMNYGLPTIVNGNGSMADLPDDAVWKLPDEFSDAQLVEALETLWRDAPLRQKMGKRSREIIITRHAPRACADQYFAAIENIHRSMTTGIDSLTRAMVQLEPTPADPEALISLAEAIARSIQPWLVPRRLLVDISELVQRDSKTGIQRVVRSILREWLTHPPQGLQVEPVYATTEQGYRYARRFTLRLLGCPDDVLEDSPLEYQSGDIFLGLDLQPDVVPAQRTFYQHIRRYGVQVYFVVYDLLPILLPHAFEESKSDLHHSWLNVVAESDGVVCISKAVADELYEWLATHRPHRQRPLRIGWSHSGADIEASCPTKGSPGDAQVVLKILADRPTFLMVGTVERRKGHAQTLAAFERLWAGRLDANLVIVGKQGWMVETLAGKLRAHSELNRRLFWLEGISDEYLEKVYAVSICLIAASEGEGFGLPLVEAAHHKLSIIARNIPVFREVAGEHAFYFTGLEPASLAEAIMQWLDLHRLGAEPKSAGMPYRTWAESARTLADLLLDDKHPQWVHRWTPDRSI